MDTTDDRFEFNAPKHFFDFTKDDIEVDESYFDCPRSAESLKEASHQTLREQKEPSQQPPTVSSLSTEPSTVPSLPTEPSTVPSLPTEPSTVPSLPTETPKRHPPTPVQVMEIEPDEVQEHAMIVKSVKGRRSEVSHCGVRQSPRLAAISKALRRSNADRRSLGSGQGRTSASPRGTSQMTRVSKVRTSHKPSVAKVSGMQGLSPDDKDQLETIATFKKKIAENKKKNDVASHKPTRPGPTKPQEFHFATDGRIRQKSVTEEEEQQPVAQPRAKPLGPTRPQEFHFATDSRLKNTKPAVEEEGEGTVDFTKSLRSRSTTINKESSRGPTIPQPFNLTEPRKGKIEESSKFVSMAELNMKFHTKTPQRFRSKRAGSASGDEAEQEGKNQRGGVTIPHTPNLSTRTRSRNLNYPTHEEREQKDYEEAQKHAFKANPVNKKALGRPSTGYQVERKTVTAPEPFNLTETKKAQAPLLGLKFQEMCEKMGGSTSSLASLPHGGVPSRWDKTATKLKPFSFDSRDRTRNQQKQQNILKVIEEEKKLAEFQANAMPVFEGGVRGLPPKKPPTPTRLRPFNLHSDQRGTAKQEQFKRQLEEEELLDSERRKFHAQSDKILHCQPFLPEKSTKPLTDISGFTLNTEMRAEERNEYELHRKMKEDEIQAAKREQEQRKVEEEATEVARIRREAVHKANPVPKYKPMVIVPAAQPLTAPKAPNFATESRLRGRSTRANTTLDISSATFTAE